MAKEKDSFKKWVDRTGDPSRGWDRFKEIKGSTWDVVVETGMGNPTKAEEKAILDLGYYGETITEKTVNGLKAGKRFTPESPYRMRTSHPGEPGSTERNFKTKEALIEGARNMGGGEARPGDTDWINDIGSRIEVAGATYGEIFPDQFK